MRSFTILFLSIFFITSCADLRTKAAKKDLNEEKAKILLREMGAAHGIQHWDKRATYTVEFEDQFYGKIGKKANPYSDSLTRFELSYIPKTFDGRMSFTSGERAGTAWGIQSWNTYEMDESGEAIFQKNDDAYFWIPTYQYFIEFPLRIQEATALAYAGEQTINGKVCDGVLASWETTKPQKKIDQYLIWIDRDTKRICKLEYTIREVMSFITGAVYFNDYKDYNGIILPSSLPVESNLVKNGYMHEMRIKSFRPDIYGVDELQPNAELKKVGDQKPD
jgi:hypothetical protein